MDENAKKPFKEMSGRNAPFTGQRSSGRSTSSQSSLNSGSASGSRIAARFDPPALPVETQQGKAYEDRL